MMNVKSTFLPFRIDRPVLFPWGLLGFVLAAMLAFSVHAVAQTAHFSYAQVTLTGSFSNPNGVAVDNSGNVFIADTSNNAVKEIPSGCTASTCVATLGSGFSSPYGVAVDGSGNVFVADTGHGAVKEIPSSGGYSTVNTVRGGFSAPVGVALDASGNVFVLDANYGVVYELLASSGYSSIASVASGFLSPHGLAVDGSGNLFVADTGNSAIWEFMAAGGYIYNSMVSFGSAYSIAVDASDNLYLGNQNGTVVNKILATGGYSTTIPLGSGFAGPYGIAVNGGGTVFVADTGNSRVVKLDTASVDLGTIAIGQASATIPLTFTFDTGGTIASPVALTQGASGLDFAIASGGTCTAGTYSAGNTCTVNVALSPQYPGLRMGAVVLSDASGNAIASVYTHGVGSGPTPSFSPGTQSTLPVAGLNQPFGVTVDAAGNIYIADDGNSRVVKIAAIGGTQSTVGTGLGNPHSVAVDGAGNVYIADYANVYKVYAKGSSQPNVAATGVTNPCGVAGAGAGNLYIANCGGSSNFVVEVHADGSAQTTVGSGLYLTDGVAVDGANNVYIADTGNNRVVKVSATGAQNTVFTGEADDVVADSAGTIYVAQANAGSVVKVPADGSAQSTVGTGLSHPYGMGLDQTGNVYIANSGTNQVVKVDQADAPTLTFASTNVNSTSAAQDVVVGNAGSSSLDISQIVISTNFTLQGPDTNCATNGQTLALGASCILGIEFAPQSTGTISGSVVLTDNALNVTGATQSISLSGTGLAAGPQTTPTVTTWPTVSPITYGQTLASSVLSGGVASVPGSFAFTTPNAIPAAGITAQSVTFTPTDTTNHTTVTGTLNITVNPATLMVTANNQSRVYDVANPALTYTIGGYVNGDSSSVVSGSASCTTTATISSASGSYPITCTQGTLAAGNYTFAFTPGTLTVTFVDLVEQSVSFSGVPSSGGSLQISDTVLNQGTGAAGGSTTGLYLSTNGTTKGSFLGYHYVGTLGPGVSSPATTTVMLPNNVSGTYYVIACANYNNGIVESNTANDCSASGSFTVAGADLAESAVSVLTASPQSGGSLQVSDTATNQGGGSASGSLTGFYLSTNGTTKGSYVGYRYVGVLAPAAVSGPVTTTLTLPNNLSGTYYVIACANYNNAVVESNMANNCSASGSFTVAAADLVESAVNVLTASPQSGGSLQVSDTAINQGGGSASGSLTGFYLSSNGTTKGSYLGYRYVGVLAPAAVSGPVTTTLALPNNLSGTYYVIACANYNNAVVESNMANDCSASGSFTVP